MGSLETANRSLTGVGTLIVPADAPGDRFLTIRESTDNKITHKLRGMLTLPMETGEPGESLDQTIDRLFKEELSLKGEYRKMVKLGLYELKPGVILNAYLYQADPDVQITIGTHAAEVSGPKWIRFQDVLDNPPNRRRFRPGVFEVVSSYFDYLKDPTNYKPQVYTASEITRGIPAEVFKLIEQGVTRTEALSRFGLSQ